MPPESRMGPI
ncbi:hypothetical protein EYZ11_004854 [Aspergillus tanneri]|uniref:Uncharacterized protein n=1 Tax=Aspergillus tanneri TaxID=1220188 RepID=A0A4S3JLU3_9EURO|nr:hypothetical protein EYZ11_004854 [Aspergillus tanneri]